MRISADLFGLTTVNSDGLGIGQVIQDAYQYFDRYLRIQSEQMFQAILPEPMANHVVNQRTDLKNSSIAANLFLILQVLTTLLTQ